MEIFKIKRYLKVKLMQNVLMARFMQLSVVYSSPFWLYNLLIFVFHYLLLINQNNLSGSLIFLKRQNKIQENPNIT